MKFAPVFITSACVSAVRITDVTTLKPGINDPMCQSGIISRDVKFAEYTTQLSEKLCFNATGDLKTNCDTVYEKVTFEEIAHVCCPAHCGRCEDNDACGAAFGADWSKDNTAMTDTQSSCCPTSVLAMIGALPGRKAKSCDESTAPCILAHQGRASNNPGAVNAAKDCESKTDDGKHNGKLTGDAVNTKVRDAYKDVIAKAKTDGKAAAAKMTNGKVSNDMDQFKKKPNAAGQKDVMTSN